MKKEKKEKKVAVEAENTQEQEAEKKDLVPQEPSDDDIEVNDPGDCIGHWAVCEECEMCEIQESCQAMTKNINGEGDSNAEEK